MYTAHSNLAGGLFSYRQLNILDLCVSPQKNSFHCPFQPVSRLTTYMTGTVVLVPSYNQPPGTIISETETILQNGAGEAGPPPPNCDDGDAVSQWSLCDS
jgi:hypothetical protein